METTRIVSVTLYTLSSSETLIPRSHSDLRCRKVPVCPHPSAHGRHHVRVVWVPKGRVYWGGRGKHVSSVAEGWQVAHGHVSGQRGGAEGGTLVVHAFGEILVAVAAPLVLFGFVGHFPVACLYSFLFHGQWPVHLCSKGVG